MATCLRRAVVKYGLTGRCACPIGPRAIWRPQGTDGLPI